MSALIQRLLARAQRWIATWSYRRHARVAPDRPISWVVGPVEVANMVASIAAAIPDAYSVSLQKHPFYADTFGYGGSSASRPWPLRMFEEAWVFGRLAAWSTGFVYVGPGGFLRAQPDARAYEFAFLKSRGKKLCCFFTGSDIRSIPVMAEQERRLGLPNIATYLVELSPVFTTESYDLDRRRLAATADEHADVIFNAAVDQAGYLSRETLPFRYFYPADRMVDPHGKFDAPERLLVVHAPSSPLIKGTPLVRAAVAALREQGFDFEYLELGNVPHHEVEAALARAHIVLNEFYAFMPGVFGVEAMAAGAVLLTSADERIETDLPTGSNEAWIVTQHHRVEANLRAALTMPVEQLLAQAEAGQRWVRAHATDEVSGRAILATLDGVSGA